MATRRANNRSAEPSQLDRDAKEFGIGVRCGGWRLGLLVARNVAPGKAGRPKAGDNHSLENDKVSMNAFAEQAGVSPSHVKYYFDAWELAAQAGLVPKSDQIIFGDEEVDVDIDSIEVDDNPRTQWSHFYGLAKNPPPRAEKPEKKEDSKAKPKDDSRVNKDFGIEPEDDEEDSMTESQRAEADSAISRNTLIEVLESVQAVKSRVERISSATAHAEILSQIRSAAQELMDLAASLEQAAPILRAV